MGLPRFAVMLTIGPACATSGTAHRTSTGTSVSDGKAAGGAESRSVDGAVPRTETSHVANEDSKPVRPGAEPVPVPQPATGFGQIRSYPELGIEVLGVRLTAANYMIDVRYRVVDSEKAIPWMNRRAKTYLVDEASGARFFSPSPPKVGPLRQTSRKPLAGRSYFMMFANPGGFVKRGAKVSVVVGEIRLEHLILE